MDPRYAFFIWGSYGVAALAVLWNVVAPHLLRNQLKARLSEALDQTQEET